MLRIFLPLYIILAVFIISFAVGVIVLPEFLLAKTVAKTDEKMTKGTFYLIESELEGLSDEQQLLKIKQLQAHFGYSLQLLKAGDPFFDSDIWDNVMSNGFFSPDIDEEEYYLKKMKKSGRVIAISFSDSQSDTDHREAKGTFYLIQKKLSQFPQDQWAGQIKTMQPYFGMPISIKLISNLTLTPNKKNLLQSGKIIALDHETSQWRFYGKLKDSVYVIQMGPFDQPITLPVLLSIIFGTFIFLLAVAIFLWIHPLWRSIKELSQSADSFGQGHLEARANVNRHAVLGIFACQFNAMADQISCLVTKHRDLTNAVSHELRTPIARMRFGMEMLENTDGTTKQRHLEGLNTDIDDLENLVNELLHYARFEQTESIADLEIVEMVAWLTDIIENAQGYTGHIEINFIHNVSTTHSAQCNPHHLARVVHNLLRNACRYSQQKIHVILETDENNIIIKVDDDGIGIRKLDRQRIFEPFSRLDESRDRLSGGHGLGLAISKRIMSAHDGTIAICDSPQGGARFTISWPKECT